MKTQANWSPAEQHDYNRIVRVFNIIDRSLFHLEPPLGYSRILRALEILTNLIKAYEFEVDRLWWIGESGSCSLADLIPGAYWFCMHYHSGQDSPEYRLQCILGTVFEPGMSSLEPESSEADVYAALEDICGFKSES